MKKELKVGDVVKDFGLNLEPLKWYEEVYYISLRYYEDIKYFFEKKYQTLKYGFPEEDAWGFSGAHARWVVPRLKHLRKISHGHPGGFDTCAEWEDVLEKMIWSFENYDKEPDPIKPIDYDSRYVVTQIHSTGQPCFKCVDEREWDFSLIEQHEKRVQEGINLFAKYYYHLWD